MSLILAAVAEIRFTPSGRNITDKHLCAGVGGESEKKNSFSWRTLAVGNGIFLPIINYRLFLDCSDKSGEI
jgi:hypothetical protein